MGEKKGLWQTVQGKLPRTLQHQLPVAELAGDERVLIERHRSIARYSREEIAVDMAYGQLCIRGRALELTQLSREQLVIGGKIDSLCVQRNRS